MLSWEPSFCKGQLSPISIPNPPSSITLYCLNYRLSSSISCSIYRIHYCLYFLSRPKGFFSILQSCVFDLNQKFIFIDYLSIVKVIIFIPDWFILNFLSLQFHRIFLFNSFTIFFWYDFLYFCVRLSSNDIVRRYCLFYDIFRSGKSVYFLCFIVIFKFFASLRCLICMGNGIVTDSVCVSAIIC